VSFDARLEERLFDDQNIVMLGGTAEQMLRTLPDEIPPQMRETDEERLVGARLERRTEGMRLRPQTLMHSAILKYRCVVTIGRKITVRGE